MNEPSPDLSAPTPGNYVAANCDGSNASGLGESHPPPPQEPELEARARTLNATADVGPYRPGDIIAGKYELLRVISQGGMGWIWVARHLTLQIETAIKLIRPDLHTETLTERFINEARIAAHVEHPGIVSIFDLGVTERGDPFIVMELLRGEDLRELLRRSVRLSPIRAVQLLLPVADALAAAHGRGIVHRDLKPENVFIVGLEQRILPKIVDFGIAKPGWPRDRRLTQSGTVMGSPEYMSPEQAQGREDVDQRVDVWSFCIVLYECMVGRPPFYGNYESTLNEILDKPIVPITELGIAEPALWTILEHGLAKQREQRFQDMRSLGRALAEWLLERGVEDDVCTQSLRATWLKDSMPSRPDFHPNVTPAAAAARSAPDGRAAGTARFPEAVTLNVAAATPASWGFARAASHPGSKTLKNTTRRTSTRVLALALTLFGVGCAGGSVWLGSTLASPRPPAISGKLMEPARTLCEELAIARHPRSPAVLLAQVKDVEPAAMTMIAPAPERSGEPSQVQPARKARPAARGQAPRRAKMPAELVFGF